MEKNYVIMAVKGGFYFFGELLGSDDGYMRLINASMFGGYGGGKGVPGVHRGDPESTVILDKYKPETEIVFPESAVLVVMTGCVDLYNFKGTELR